MGNGQDCAFKGIDIAFQPFYTAQIQMVGGFVQQQDVGLFQQKSCQIYSCLFSTG